MPAPMATIKMTASATGAIAVAIKDRNGRSFAILLRVC
jgi:hypothetical protein